MFATIQLRTGQQLSKCQQLSKTRM